MLPEKTSVFQPGDFELQTGIPNMRLRVLIALLKSKASVLPSE